MKGKITVVLLGLALVFGMIAASCDNGTYPTLDAKDTSTQFAYDGTDGTGLPKFTDGDTTKPKIIQGQALFDMLAEYSSLPTATDPNNRVKTYILTKIAAPASSDDDAALKTKYAGMPLIVKNPEL